MKPQNHTVDHSLISPVFSGVFWNAFEILFVKLQFVRAAVFTCGMRKNLKGLYGAHRRACGTHMETQDVVCSGP